jgi:phosphinothricin acetyltransferase
MSGVVRPGTAADAGAIAEIYREAVLNGTATYETEPPDAAEMARRLDVLVSAGFPYLVADDRGRVSGYAYAGPFRARAAYCWTVEDSIYVAKDAQGRGIGLRLLAALIERSTAAGFRQMVAVIGGREQVASIAMHEKAGFAHVGLMPGVGFKHGRWLDNVLMQRALGEGAASAPRPPSR